MAIFLERAEKTAEAILTKLSPHCQRIAIAGSVRRKVKQVNDIDFVLIPADPWRLNQELLALGLGRSKASGSKIMRIEVNGIQVDFYFASEETWATLLLIRTGSKENNIRLCSIAKRRGWHLAASGDGLFNENGERIAGDSEESVYAMLGLSFQPPERR